jgi:putative transposase
MRLKAEEFVSGQYYHVYNHSVADQILFKDEEDYHKCLSIVKRYYNAIDYSIIAYCLMPNHFHFLLYQKNNIPFYRHFEHLWYSYTCFYNKKYQRQGTLFAGKLQHIGIREEAYLLRLCAYIHLNPVKASLVKLPEEWQWSNYQEWIVQRNGSLIDREQIKLFFASPEEYKACIESMYPQDNKDKYLLDFD